ncbi:MAG: 16S rRNA (cytosine(1402)-N(4))-methyltransferase, partial [Gemmatimonadota bacterium]
MDGGEYEHEAVLVTEVVARLRPERGGLFLDATVGGGGHAAAILESGRTARVVAMDRDPAAVDAARSRLQPFADRVELVRGDFRQLAERSARPGWSDLAGALLDLGVSSPQIDESARGFSFRPDAPLDMRMGGT